MSAAHAHSLHRLACHPRTFWQYGVALLLSLMWAAPALACTQPPGGTPHYTISQHVRAADVVLNGTITQVTSDNYNYTATVQVQEYFKGSGPAIVTITNFGTGADCRSVVRTGDDWIFFANGDPNADMSANYLSAGDAISTPNADTIAQIIAALNIRPRAYLPLLVGGAVVNIAAGAPSSKSDGMAIGEVLLLVVGALRLWQRFLTSRI